MTMAQEIGMPDLTIAERAAVSFLSDGSTTATHWIARHCSVNCDKARRLLYRLERRGLVESVRAFGSGRVFWWKITDAGRAVLAPEALR